MNLKLQIYVILTALLLTNIASAADPNTGLFFAASQGNNKHVESYIANGADVNYTDKHLKIPVIGIAIMKGHTETVAILLEHGANPDSKINVEGGYMRPLHWSMLVQQLPSAKVLVKNGANLGLTDSFGNTPLISAASNNYPAFAELYLSAGARVDQQDHKKRTALHWAVFSGNDNIARLLITHGADVNAVTSDRRTPLSIAKKKNDKQMVVLLRNAGAEK
jgi:ankyrin repeat protein